MPNLSIPLPLLAQPFVIIAECLASELLYRGVGVGGTADWLRDRAFEAGANELVPVPQPLAGLINAAALAAMPGSTTEASLQELFRALPVPPLLPQVLYPGSLAGELGAPTVCVCV